MKNSIFKHQVLKWNSGCKEAPTLLFEPVLPSIRKTVYWNIWNKAVAEDAVNQTVLTACKKKQNYLNFESLGMFKGSMILTAKTICIKWNFRAFKLSVREKNIPSDELDSIAIDAGYDGALSGEEKSRLLLEIKHLPDHYTQVIGLRYFFHQLPFDEIGEAFQSEVSGETARNWHSKGLKILRNRMAWYPHW